MSDQKVTASNEPTSAAAKLSKSGLSLHSTEVRSPLKIMWWRFRRNRAALVGMIVTAIVVFVAVLSPWIRPHEPLQPDLSAALETPSWTYLLGADEMGRDILSRIMEGARITMMISGTAVSIGLVIGIIVGVVSGFYRGFIDSLLMRLIDILLALPGILLAITIIAVLGIGLHSIVIAIGIAAIPPFARLARSSTLTVSSEEYVVAARCIGATNSRIMVRHVLPNIVAPLIVQTSLMMATAILLTSGLSFLGLGAQPPSPEWGAMLSTGRSYLASSPHVAVFPGLAIMIVVFGLNLLGDGLRDALDPRSE